MRRGSGPAAFGTSRAAMHSSPPADNLLLPQISKVKEWNIHKLYLFYTQFLTNNIFPHCNIFFDNIFAILHKLKHSSLNLFLKPFKTHNVKLVLWFEGFCPASHTILECATECQLTAVNSMLRPFRLKGQCHEKSVAFYQMRCCFRCYRQ